MDELNNERIQKKKRMHLGKRLTHMSTRRDSVVAPLTRREAGRMHDACTRVVSTHGDTFFHERQKASPHEASKYTQILNHFIKEIGVKMFMVADT